MIKRTKDWWKASPKVLVIGHDPTLQISETIAEFALFADYYFKDEAGRKAPGDAQKYKFAASTFDCIHDLTGGLIKPEEVYITNLCDRGLERDPTWKSKTVYISKEDAEHGIKRIREILAEHEQIKLILPMSLQVNYWLQELGFYPQEEPFLKGAAPSPTGVKRKPPYYQPKKSGIFQQICGRQFLADDQYPLFPILHMKNYPLNKRFKEYYGEAYDKMKQEIPALLSSAQQI